jgi:hypothetical protein
MCWRNSAAMLLPLMIRAVMLVILPLRVSACGKGGIITEFAAVMLFV